MQTFPKGKAQVDIAQHANGTLEVSYKAELLRYRRLTVNEHLKAAKSVDDKQLNQRVDAAMQRQRRQMARLQAQMAHQDSQRNASIYWPDSPASNPPRAPC